MSKRTVVVTETRKISYVHQLFELVASLPPTSPLRDIHAFDGEVTIQWEEQR